MGGGAEAVDAEPPRRLAAGQAPGAIADQPGAEQRRARLGVVTLHGEGVAGVGHAILRIAAVPGVAGELGPLAEVLLAATARRALATGPTQPGHAEALTGRHSRHALPQGGDLADDLVAGHQ